MFINTYHFDENYLFYYKNFLIMKKLSVIFSFKNEDENLTELVKRISQNINKLKTIKDYELIFVDDNSDDNSVETLKILMKNYPISIIKMSRTFGVTPCVIAGLEYSSGDAVIYMDSDLQDPPELIPDMCKKFNDGFEVVHTVRKNRHGESSLKIFITKAAYKVINFFSEVELQTDAGDFKLLSRRVVDKILDLNEYDPYMRGLSVWVGFKQCSILYDRDARFKGKTHFSLLANLNPFKEFVRGITSFSIAPLYFSLFVGLFGLVMSFGIIIYALITKYMDMSIPGSSGILVVLGFLFSIVMIANGFLGIYIAKIYGEVKARPKYIIEEIIK